MIRFRIADAANQRFSTILNGRRVSFRLRFNHTTGRWSFDLAIDGDYVLHGRRIVTGADLLKPFGFGIGVIFAASTTGQQPGREELINGDVGLYQVSEAKLAAIST